MDVPLQVMDLQVKYYYYKMCTLQDMDLKQELNQSVTDGRTRVTLYVTSIFVTGHKNIDRVMNKRWAKAICFKTKLPDISEYLHGYPISCETLPTTTVVN